MKKIKIFAFICALAIGLSLTGCADTTWALKYGNITVSTGVYNYFLVVNASNVANSASSGSSATSSNMWSQTYSNTTASTWAMNSALDSCKQLAVIEKLAADNKVSLTAANKTAVANTASSAYSPNSGVFSKNGISEESIERIVKDYSYLEPSLFKAMYGVGGKKAVSESELEAYYKKNFVCIKQIFIAKFDVKNSKAYTKKQIAAAKEKANMVYKLVSSDPKNYNKYVTKYTEDPGIKSQPDGYTISKASAASMNFDTKFTNLAFKLKVGEVKMAEGSSGYYIERRMPLDMSSKTFTSSLKDSARAALKGTEFTKMIANMVKTGSFVKNDNTLNHYSPQSIDLTTAS